MEEEEDEEEEKEKEEMTEEKETMVVARPSSGVSAAGWIRCSQAPTMLSYSFVLTLLFLRIKAEFIIFLGAAEDEAALYT